MIRAACYDIEKMQSYSVKDENQNDSTKASREISKVPKEKRPRSRDITELKIEAENLKLSLSSLTSEQEKSQARQRAANLNELFELLQTTNVKMDRKILEHITELLKLDVHPDSIVEMLKRVMTVKDEKERVTFI